MTRISLIFVFNNSLLNLWESHISHPNSAHFLVSPCLPLPQPPIENLKNRKPEQARKQTNKKQKKTTTTTKPLLSIFPTFSNTSSFILVALGALVCHIVYPFSVIFISMFITMSHWSGLWFLEHCHRCFLTKTPLGYLAAAQVMEILCL